MVIGNCVRDFSECDCECHTWPDSVSHIVACCSKCPYCDKRIAWNYEEHVAKCKAEYDKFMERMIKD